MGQHRDGHLDDVEPHLVPGVRDVEGRVLGGEVVHHAWHGHLGEGGYTWPGSTVPGLEATRLAGRNRRHRRLAGTRAAVDGQGRRWLAEADISHLDTVGIEVNGRGDRGERVDLPEVALGGGREDIRRKMEDMGGGRRGKTKSGGVQEARR